MQSMVDPYEKCYIFIGYELNQGDEVQNTDFEINKLVP